MAKYTEVRLIRQKLFESFDNYEARIQSFATDGWTVVSLTSDRGGRLVTLLTR